MPAEDLPYSSESPPGFLLESEAEIQARLAACMEASPAPKQPGQPAVTPQHDSDADQTEGQNIDASQAAAGQDVAKAAASPSATDSLDIMTFSPGIADRLAQHSIKSQVSHTGTQRAKSCDGQGWLMRWT